MKLKMPDGSERQFNDGANGLEISEDISKSLAKKAIAIKVNGELRDLSDPVPEGSVIEILTTQDEEGLDIMRHTLTAQVLARAVKNLYPHAKLAIGPTIENGFYYDVALDKPLSTEDLEAIEAEMRKIAGGNADIVKKYYSKDEAIALFEERGEPYKVQIIKDAGQVDNFQIYHQGDTGFIDLCHGPHLPNLKHIGAFKLTKVSGAYWRGDSQNEMLTRIYGTAWNNDKDLKKYLRRIEEAEKRDHRKLGKAMDLFHFQDNAPGAVFWHHRGWTMFNELINYMRERQKKAGYVEINTPDIMDRSLWEASGHWEKFGENMFTTEAKEERIFALKPMNCPGCVQVFNQGIKSYRQLPVRMAEFGKVHRYEPSGALHGLMRVRAFTQDDAHIFCTPDQITQESVTVCNLILDIYKDFGFEDVRIKFSDRPEKRVGSDEIWDKSEKALREALEAMDVPYSYNPGEGAFYGPKLEFVLRDAIGRDWQCGTLQMDFNLPERLDATYIGEDGEKHRPVMLHRALFGSLERFFGMLIEHYAGNMPLWLAPVQVAVTGIVEDHNDYASEVAAFLEEAGLRVNLDLRNEKVGYKIREHMSSKTTFVAVVGDKEKADRSITVRRLGVNEQKTYSLDEFRDMALEEIKTHALPPNFNPSDD